MNQLTFTNDGYFIRIKSSYRLLFRCVYLEEGLFSDELLVPLNSGADSTPIFCKAYDSSIRQVGVIPNSNYVPEAIDALIKIVSSTPPLPDWTPALITTPTKEVYQGLN